MFRLAHLTDPHLGPLPTPRFADLAGKRALGFANWRRGRHAEHDPDVLKAIIEDLRSTPYDHIAVTGDLVNIGLEAEYRFASEWLSVLGFPEQVTVVPGNHDAYVRAVALHSIRHWGKYMLADEVKASSPGPPVHFPFVRRRGPVGLIGLSSAIPTGPLMATGRVGTKQLAQLASDLAQLEQDRLFRVVLIHHPPKSRPTARFKRLIDGREFRHVLATHGAELVLHGHDHVHSVVWLDGQGGRIPAVGVPSASAAPGFEQDPAGYNIYEIDGEPGAWRCTAISRGLRPDRAGVSELTRRELLA